MSRFLGRWLALACTAGALLAGPAAATSVDFEDVSPTLFSGTSISSGGFSFTSDAFGFSGVDNSAAFSVFGNAPSNANGQFLFALNSDGITLTRDNGAAFYLDAFDAAFIAPFGGLGAGISAGELYVLGETTAGTALLDVFVFPDSTAAGDFDFSRFVTTSLHGQALTEAFFLACVYDATGFCDFSGSSGVQPQFALDNLALPEPASMALALFALGVIGARRVRRQAI